MFENEIHYLINKKTKTLKKNSPQLDDIEINYEKKKNGLFSTKIKAKIKQKTVHLSNKDFCIENSISKLFKKLDRILQRRKFRVSRRMKLSFKEAS